MKSLVVYLILLSVVHSTPVPTSYPTPFGEYDSGGEADPADIKFKFGIVVDPEIGKRICSKRGLVFEENCFCDWYKYPYPTETSMIRYRYTPKCNTTPRPTTVPTSSPTLNPTDRIIQSCEFMADQSKQYATLIDELYHTACGKQRRCGKCVRNVHEKITKDINL